MPRSVQIGVLTFTTLIVGGAVALAYSRGPALILDLANGAASFFCL